VDEGPITVEIKIRPVTATRTFSAGLRLVGANNTLTYALSVDSVLVTIGGSTADLDRLSGAALVMDLDVTDLGPADRDHPCTTIGCPSGSTTSSVSPVRVA